MSYIHTTDDGANTDGCSKHREAGGETFVFTVAPLEMARKGGTLANNTPFDSGEASQIAPLPEKGKAQPWSVVSAGLLDLPGVQCFAEQVCMWEAGVGCVGAGCRKLRNFLLPSAHDSPSSSSQLFSNHKSAGQTPFG